MKKKILWIVVVLLAVFSMTASAQDKSSDSNGPQKAVDGGQEYDFSDYQKHVCEGDLRDFGMIQSESNDLQINLEDVYLSNGLLYFSLRLGTSRSADNAVSSAGFYYNGEQRGGGGGAGVSQGEKFTKTMSFVYYGPDLGKGDQWETFILTFGGVSFTALDHSNCQELTPLHAAGYDIPLVFYNPDAVISDPDSSEVIADHGTIKTTGRRLTNRIEISLNALSNTNGTLSFDLNQKYDLTGCNGGHQAEWINGKQASGGGGSISFDGNDNPEFPADYLATDTDQFSYSELSLPEDFHLSRLGIWCHDLSFTVVYKDSQGVSQTWTATLPQVAGKPFSVVDLVQE